MTAYRPEIDGLRAVAVVPVILFHGGIAGFSGGFVGVDVFFVISGYLIASILLREMGEGRFSMWRFWERRARRILPALVVVMAVCVPLAWVLMLPEQYLAFARSLVAVSVFASNILFWRESGYFAAAAEEKPLLHTWSLAVEEQFYILFPLAVFLVWRLGRRALVAAIALVGLASLGLSHYAAHESPAANFYLLPTRAWELMAGALCALVLERRAPWQCDLGGGLGLALILTAVVAFDATTPFPSLWALLPVGGTVLIILCAGAGGQVARALSWQPVVALGLVSYSAYLWHQPLFAFARIALPGAPPVWLMLALAALSLGLAALSWRLVEQPFRNREGVFRGARLPAALVPAVVLLAGVGVHGHLSGGVPGRFPAPVQALMEVRRGDTSGCRNRDDATEIAAGAACVIGDATRPATLAVIGDSHASMLTDALHDHLAAAGRGALMFSGNWCAPLVNFATRVPRKDRDCVGRTNAAIAQIAGNGGIDTVLLVGQWSNYTTGTRPGDSETAAYTYVPDMPITEWNGDVSANPEHFAHALHATLRTLRASGKSVLIMLPVPEYEASVPQSAARLRLLGLPQTILDQPMRDHLSRHAVARSLIESARGDFDIDLYDPAQVFCDEQGCSPLDSTGRPLYEDANHLGYRGARQVVDAMHATGILQTP